LREAFAGLQPSQRRHPARISASTALEVLGLVGGTPPYRGIEGARAPSAQRARLSPDAHFSAWGSHWRSWATIRWGHRRLRRAADRVDPLADTIGVGFRAGFDWSNDRGHIGWRRSVVYRRAAEDRAPSVDPLRSGSLASGKARALLNEWESPDFRKPKSVLRKRTLAVDPRNGAGAPICGGTPLTELPGASFDRGPAPVRAARSLSSRAGWRGKLLDLVRGRPVTGRTTAGHDANRMDSPRSPTGAGSGPAPSTQCSPPARRRGVCGTIWPNKPWQCASGTPLTARGRPGLIRSSTTGPRSAASDCFV